jgi:hypothetical protein
LAIVAGGELVLTTAALVGVAAPSATSVDITDRVGGAKTAASDGGGASEVLRRVRAGLFSGDNAPAAPDAVVVEAPLIMAASKCGACGGELKVADLIGTPSLFFRERMIGAPSLNLRVVPPDAAPCGDVDRGECDVGDDDGEVVEGECSGDSEAECDDGPTVLGWTHEGMAGCDELLAVPLLAEWPMVLARAANECAGVVVGLESLLRFALGGCTAGKFLSETEVGAAGLTTAGEGSAANDCEMKLAWPPPVLDCGTGDGIGDDGAAEAPKSIFLRSCTRVEVEGAPPPDVDADSGGPLLVELAPANVAAAAEKLWLSAATLLFPGVGVGEPGAVEPATGRFDACATRITSGPGFVAGGGESDVAGVAAGAELLSGAAGDEAPTLGCVAGVAAGVESRGEVEGDGVVDVDGVATGEVVTDDEREAEADDAGDSGTAGDDGE